MKVTTNIAELIEEGYLSETGAGYTNNEIISACAELIMSQADAPKTTKKLFNLIWDECDTALAIALNDYDIEGTFEYLSIQNEISDEPAEAAHENTNRLPVNRY